MALPGRAREAAPLPGRNCAASERWRWVSRTPRLGCRNLTKSRSGSKYRCARRLSFDRCRRRTGHVAWSSRLLGNHLPPGVHVACRSPRVMDPPYCHRLKLSYVLTTTAPKMASRPVCGRSSSAGNTMRVAWSAEVSQDRRHKAASGTEVSHDRDPFRGLRRCSQAGSGHPDAGNRLARRRAGRIAWRCCWYRPSPAIATCLRQPVPWLP